MAGITGKDMTLSAYAVALESEAPKDRSLTQDALRPELNKDERRARVLKTMAAVGLLPEMINRYSHEFSGGQAQRIGIARALITEPKLIVCDEPA